MTTPIEITVVREAKSWKIRYGAVELDYATQAEALADAIALAHAFGREGQFSTVRSGVMTSVYGPNGFIRAVPSARQAKSESASDPRELARESAPRKMIAPRPPKTLDEKGRVLSIASTFEVARNGRD